MAPAAAAVEARLRDTVDAQAATPAEAAFAQRYAARLRGVLDALRQPAAGADPAADALRLLRALSDSLAQRLGCALAKLSELPAPTAWQCGFYTNMVTCGACRRCSEVLCSWHCGSCMPHIQTQDVCCVCQARRPAPGP